MTAQKTKTPDKKPTKKTGKKSKKSLAGKLFIALFIAGVLGVICAVGVYAVIVFNGRQILVSNWGKLSEFNEASHLYDVNGAEATALYRENRESVSIGDIPDKLQKAFIATEDRRFMEHGGVDLWAIGRAAVKDVIARSAVEGGSTITQQLAKNVFLNKDKTFFRKATEMAIAVAMEGNINKDEILQQYLNYIYFGNGAYGVKAAAKKYFGVSDLSKLETWQMATLAAIPKSPSNYNPIDNPDKSKDRRAVVLKLMFDQGYITEEEKTAGSAAEYKAPADTGKKEFLTYIDYVVKEAGELYGLNEDDLLRNGYKIYTAMDSGAQKIMEQTYAQWPL
jgi:penicillin-binding protein 2A